MTDTQQSQDPFRTIKIVDHPIITHAKPVGIESFQAVVRVPVQGQPKSVNGRLNPRLLSRRQAEEVSVEVARVDLQRGT